MTPSERSRATVGAGVERVGRVATEGERVHGHRDHVAEHQQPEQQTGELRVALLAEVVERSSGPARRVR